MEEDPVKDFYLRKIHDKFSGKTKLRKFALDPITSSSFPFLSTEISI